MTHQTLLDVDAYIFDVFGTVVDWRTSVARFVAPFLQDIDPLTFAEEWRARYQPAMEGVRSGGRDYVALDDLHFEMLGDTLEHFGVAAEFDDATRWAMNRAWEHLDPWPDVLPGLKALRDRALIAPCSNGSIALMSRLARYAHLPWHCVLGADLARDYKPQPQVYLACCHALRLPVERVAMVAAHNDDLHAARACGLKTVFIPRLTEHGPHQTTDLEPDSDWDGVIQDLSALG
ncbi:MAG: haloacid dehalogenase type II [Pseudomonadota bacterium]